MVENWKLKLVYNNIIRFIFTTDVTISPVFYNFSFCPFLHYYGRQHSLTFYYCPHSLQLLRPLPSSVVSVSWSPRLCNIMIMQSAITITAINVPGHPLLFRHPCIGSLLIGSLGLSLVLLGGPLSCKVPLVAPGHLRQCSRATIRGKYQVWNQSQILQIWFAGWVKEEISLMCWQNCRLFLSLLPENGLVTNPLTKI